MEAAPASQCYFLEVMETPALKLWALIPVAALLGGCEYFAEQGAQDSQELPAESGADVSGEGKAPPHPAGAKEGSGEDDSCTRSVSEFEPSETLPNGVLGSDWIAQLELDRELKVGVPKNAASGVVLEPNSEGQGGRLAIRALPGKIRHIRSVPKPVPKGMKSMPALCFDSYAVDVELTLKSDDGAIDGRWKSIASRLDRNDPDLGKFEKEEMEEDAASFDSFAVSIRGPQSEMQGTLKASVPDFQQELDEADSTENAYSIYVRHDGSSMFEASLELRWSARRILKKSKKHPGHNVVSESSHGGLVYSFE